MGAKEVIRKHFPEARGELPKKRRTTWRRIFASTTPKFPVTATAWPRLCRTAEHGARRKRHPPGPCRIRQGAARVGAEN